MREVQVGTDQRRFHAEAGALGQLQPVVERLHRAAQREGNHAAGGIGGAGDAEVVCARGRMQRPKHVADLLLLIGDWPGEEKEKEYELIAFFGQVKVKVTGPINEGDYIIPSSQNDGTGIAIPKEAITPKDFSNIVGQAWQTNLSKETKLVLAGVGFNFTMPKIGSYLERIDSLEIKMKELENKQIQIETKWQTKWSESKDFETNPNEQAGGLRPFIEDHADIPIKSIKIQSNRYLEIV